MQNTFLRLFLFIFLYCSISQLFFAGTEDEKITSFNQAKEIIAQVIQDQPERYLRNECAHSAEITDEYIKINYIKKEFRSSFWNGGTAGITTPNIKNIYYDEMGAIQISKRRALNIIQIDRKANTPILVYSLDNSKSKAFVNALIFLKEMKKQKSKSGKIDEDIIKNIRSIDLCDFLTSNSLVVPDGWKKHSSNTFDLYLPSSYIINDVSANEDYLKSNNTFKDIDITSIILWGTDQCVGKSGVLSTIFLTKEKMLSNIDLTILLNLFKNQRQKSAEIITKDICKFDHKECGIILFKLNESKIDIYEILLFWVDKNDLYKISLIFGLEDTVDKINEFKTSVSTLKIYN